MNAPTGTKSAPHAIDSAITWGIAAVAVFALLRAVRLAWLCDDSFISIRYAQNFADGLGLVYNAGEYVEGYTNFLWTVMLAAYSPAL